MPVWLSKQLIIYTVMAVVGSAGVVWAYSSIRNHFIEVENLHTELSNERDRANRAEVSLAAELLANQLREDHVAEVAEIRAEAQDMIDKIRTRSENLKEVMADRERLARVTIAKPKLVEKLANKATERVFRDLENIFNSR